MYMSRFACLALDNAISANSTTDSHARDFRHDPYATDVTPVFTAISLTTTVVSKLSCITRIRKLT